MMCKLIQENEFSSESCNFMNIVFVFLETIQSVDIKYLLIFISFIKYYNYYLYIGIHEYTNLSLALTLNTTHHF